MKKLTLFLCVLLLLLAMVSEALATTYVGNLNSWKFHYYGCRWERQMYEKNRYYTANRQELIDMGMVPCKVCRP